MLRTLNFAFGVLVAALAAWQIGMLLQVWSIRATYPYDIEWMEGATLISALRVTQGLPLYGMPEATYIPFIYPPLYAWVVGGLASIFPFGYTLGRVVSIVGTLTGAGALVFGARDAGARWPMAFGCAAIFLGTWEETGAFFDLVRIDGLSIALIGWALVLAVGDTPRRAIAGGLMLALAFTCKHHAAALGFPIAAALWYRDGRAQALRFGLAAAIPALLFVIAMEIGTGGRFLLWLVEVPSRHGIVGDRFWPTVEVKSWSPFRHELSGAGLEVFAATPLLWLAAGGTAAIAIARDVRSAGLGGAVLRLFGGLGVVGALGNAALLATPDLARRGGGYVIEALWSALAVIAVLVLLTMLARARTPLAASRRFFYWTFTSMVGFAVISLMRGHVGGFTNVLIPMMWLQALWPALLVRRAGEGVAGLTLSALVAGQIWLGHANYTKHIPTTADRQQGDALIAELRELPGPVLLTDAPYYAVMAGHEPSFALIALWDISDKDCPPEAGTAVIRELLRQHYWKSGVFPDGKPGSGIEREYERVRKLKAPGPRTFTGWAVKFRQVWGPKAETGRDQP